MSVPNNGRHWVSINNHRAYSSLDPLPFLLFALSLSFFSTLLGLRLC